MAKLTNLFTKTGDIYVSVHSGNDASYPTSESDDTSEVTLKTKQMQCVRRFWSNEMPALNFMPKKSIQSAINSLPQGVTTCIIGSGDYYESFSTVATKSISFIGDGTVYITGQPGSRILYFNGRSNRPQPSYIIDNINFRRFDKIFIYDTVHFLEVNNTISFYNVQFLDINEIITLDGVSAGVNVVNFFDSVFINVDEIKPSVSHGELNAKGCIFVDCNMTNGLGFNKLENSYISEYSNIRFRENAVNIGSHCNIRGRVVINRNGLISGSSCRNVFMYFMPDDSGVIPGGMTYGQWLSLYPTLPLAKYEYDNINCFRGNPRFQNDSKLDFSLRENSPHIKAGLNNMNIGSTKLSVSHYTRDQISPVHIYNYESLNTTCDQGEVFPHYSIANSLFVGMNFELFGTIYYIISLYKVGNNIISVNISTTLSGSRAYGVTFASRTIFFKNHINLKIGNLGSIETQGSNLLGYIVSAPILLRSNKKVILDKINYIGELEFRKEEFPENVPSGWFSTDNIRKYNASIDANSSYINLSNHGLAASNINDVIICTNNKIGFPSEIYITDIPHPDVIKINKNSSNSSSGIEFDILNPMLMPNHLTYQMRWKNDNTNYPVSISLFNNSKSSGGGNFTRFKWNEIPTIDSNSVGNGVAEHDLKTATFLEAYYIQLIIHLVSI